MNNRAQKYPYIGIYARFTDGGKFARNEHFKSDKERKEIISRMISWQAKKAEKFEKLILYIHETPDQNEIIYHSERSYRLWMKYAYKHLEHAQNADTGITQKSIKTCEPGKGDNIAITQLLIQASNEITRGHLWQARIYNPANEIIFHWDHKEGEKKPGNWLDFINQSLEAHG